MKLSVFVILRKHFSYIIWSGLLCVFCPQELRAVAGLKSALVTESHGKLHFHKVGKDYVLFRSDLQREVAPKQEADKERQLAPVQTLYNTNEDDTNHTMESFT